MTETELTPDQEQTLTVALLSAFREKPLAQALRHRMGVRLEWEVDTANPFRVVVGDLVGWAVETGSVEQLVRTALHERPGNTKVQAVAAELGVTLPDPVEAGGAGTQALEKVVRTRSRLLDFGAFTSGIARIGRQICRIEIPGGAPRGTGWLVGPDLLLTAAHVIESATVAPRDGGDIVCRFDYGAKGETGRTAAVAASWLLAHAPPAALEQGARGAPPPTPQELDFALVRLADRVGDDAVDGEPRGWIAVPERPAVVDRDDFMVVPQHPSGDALKVAFGEVLGPDETGVRLRYDTSTEPGSSGAPCFDLDLRPFGVHQAGGAGAYNQCVPLRLIVRHVAALRADGADVPAFWADA